MSQRALYTAISGIRNQAVYFDVIANNIANSGTMGFKRGRMTFEESFALLLQGASRPPGEQGGVNPLQIGNGTSIGSIDSIITQGNIQVTGNQTDLAIRGDGFFVVSDGKRDFFTRAGSFQWDSNGRLVLPFNGMKVQGRIAENGKVTEGSPIGDVIVPFGTVDKAKATTSVSFVGNLDSATQPGEMINSAAMRVFDSLGNSHTLTLSFEKDAALPNSWLWEISVSGLAELSGGFNGTVTFDSTGSLETFAYSDGSSSFTFDPKNGAEGTMDIALNFGTPGTADGIMQFSSTTTVIARDQDGFSSGVLENVMIDDVGTITGVFSNGNSRILSKIVLATFNNPSGLLRIGDNIFDVSTNSGLPLYGLAGTYISADIIPGAVEMSNVDLAEEFTNMIIAQRSFQANARTVTTADEMLQETVNLKR